MAQELSVNERKQLWARYIPTKTEGNSEKVSHVSQSEVLFEVITFLL
jgi:hypothetical protein